MNSEIVRSLPSRVLQGRQASRLQAQGRRQLTFADSDATAAHLVKGESLIGHSRTIDLGHNPEHTGKRATNRPAKLDPLEKSLIAGHPVVIADLEVMAHHGLYSDANRMSRCLSEECMCIGDVGIGRFQALAGGIKRGQWLGADCNDHVPAPVVRIVVFTTTCKANHAGARQQPEG